MGKLLSNFRHDARMHRKSLAVQLRAAATLRGAFVMQVLGMVVNNAGFILAWMFFFDKFGAINGWSVQELIGLNGIMMLIFGIMMLTSTGILDLPTHVDQGSFDSFLVRPASVLGQLAGSNIDVTNIGDIGMGIVLTTWYVVVSHASLGATCMFLLTFAIGCVIFWTCAILLPNILAFYMFDSDRLVRYTAYIFMDGALYPTGILRGALRTILLTALPSLFIGAVQIDLLKRVSLPMVGLGAVVAVLWLVFALWLFRRAVRRYESANLVGAR